MQELSRHLQQEAERLLLSWLAELETVAPRYIHIESGRLHDLFFKNIQLLVQGLNSTSGEERQILDEQIFQLARAIAAFGLDYNLLLTDLLQSLSVCRRIMLNEVRRLLKHRMWIAHPRYVLEAEQRINQVLDAEMMALSQLYIQERETIIQQREESLRTTNRQLITLNDLSMNISSSLDTGATLDGIVHAMEHLLENPALSVLVVQQSNETLSIVDQHGHCGEYQFLHTCLTRILEQELAQRLFSQGLPYILDDLNATPLAAGERPLVHSLVILPLRSADKLTGFITLGTPTTYPFTPQQLNLLLALATQAGMALEKAQLYSQLEKAYEEQKKIDAQKDEFLHIVSHEFRTPLALIKGYAATLLRTELSLAQGTKERFLEGILSATDRMTRIMENLLDTTRIELGKLKLNLKVIDICQLAKKVLTGYQTQVTKHTLCRNFAKKQLWILADPDQIEQVLLNLVNNAVKYSPHGGQVTVTIMEQDVEVSISVSDQGLGIPVSDLNHIFEKFYRAENTARSIIGNGLGLYICKSIVEAHNGSIRVQSREGQGTTFCFTLPKAEPPTPQPLDLSQSEDHTRSALNGTVNTTISPETHPAPSARGDVSLSE